MTVGKKIVFITFLFTTLTWMHLKSQVPPANEYGLNLAGSNGKIENVINMEVSPYVYESMQLISGRKINIPTDNLVINGDTLKPGQVSTRGQSTLNFKRKSISFKLNAAAVFRHGDRTEKLKKFDAISLSMDKYYTRNRLAFGMMEEMELFGLFYTFCDLRINGKSEGIYMIIERPEDWAQHKKKSPLVIRRGYDHNMDKIDMEKGINKTEKNNYLEEFKLVYKSIHKYHGPALYDTLSKWIDLDNYMKWLAFNFLVRNGDYADEVFFYIDPEIGKFRIIPWDYDDLFSVSPHEGKDVNKNIAGKLVFSSEDILDVKIATDPYLYTIYLSVFKQMLNTLTPGKLKTIFEDTWSELYPYYLNKEIISNSQNDYYKDANLQTLKYELGEKYMLLRKSIELYREYPGIK
jgi:spore coat protein H